MVTGSWLIRGWPVCSSFCLLVPGLSVAGFSVRVMVTGAVTTLSAHTLLIRGSSLVHLFGSWSLVCIPDSWSLTCSTVGLSLVHRWCVADLSARLPLARH